jgi:hypothetical protein
LLVAGGGLGTASGENNNKRNSNETQRIHKFGLFSRSFWIAILAHTIRFPTPKKMWRRSLKPKKL